MQGAPARECGCTVGQAKGMARMGCLVVTFKQNVVCRTRALRSVVSTSPSRLEAIYFASKLVGYLGGMLWRGHGWPPHGQAHRACVQCKHQPIFCGVVQLTSGQICVVCGRTEVAILQLELSYSNKAHTHSRIRSSLYPYPTCTPKGIAGGEARRRVTSSFGPVGAMCARRHALKFASRSRCASR